MLETTGAGPRWALLTVWAIVNSVNLLQSVGFASRVRYGMRVNHALGFVIVALALPAGAALVGFARERAGWLDLAGPAVFLGFVLFHTVVQYVHPIDFRAPGHAGILVPYLVLFFGSILLMGLPMFRVSLPLWAVTATTTVILLSTMVYAMRHGVG